MFAGKSQRKITAMPEFTLPALPYAYDALEPHIDTLTMQIHHDKHHAAYVANLNAALKDHPDFQSKSIEEIISNLDAVPEAARTAVRNNGGGHINHTFFWEIMKPGGAKEPTGALAEAIKSTFGDLEGLKKQVNEGGAKRFGRQYAQSGQSAFGRQDAPARRRRVGTRLLPEISEQAP